MKKKELVTTKECPLCGNRDLLLFSTINLKTCTDCDTDIAWVKLENEPPFYCARPTRVTNEEKK